jgi:hypothetical protein
LKRGFLFLLDEGKTGTLQWLQGLYPGGETEKMLDQEGHPLVYGYRVAAGTATDPLKAYQRSAQGLTAAYYFHGSGNGKPDLVQREPLINFTFRNDFPVPGPSPFNARWTGILLAPAAGDYGFVALTTDECRLSLDGREVLGPGKENTGKVRLTKGPHRLELGFNKSMGFDAALSLLWVKPGDVKYGVVPASAYRLGTSPAGTTK